MRFANCTYNDHSKAKQSDNLTPHEFRPPPQHNAPNADEANKCSFHKYKNVEKGANQAWAAIFRQSWVRKPSIYPD